MTWLAQEHMKCHHIERALLIYALRWFTKVHIESVYEYCGGLTIF